MQQQEDFLDNFLQDKSDDFEIDEMDFDLDFDGNVERDLCIQGYMITKPKKFADIPANRIKAKNAKKLAADLCLCEEENTFCNVVIPGDFVFCDLLSALADSLNSPIELDIATLSYSNENVDTLKKMFDSGNMTRLGIVVSDYFYANERRGVYRYTLNSLPLEKTDIAVAGVHTKIHLIKTADERYFVLEGSANLRSSQNVEQFTFCKSKPVYMFHKKWISQLIEKYSVIRKNSKSIRGAKLWSEIEN